MLHPLSAVVQTEHQEVNVAIAIELVDEGGSWRARLAHPLLVHLAIIGRTKREALLRAKAAALRALADQADQEPEVCPTTLRPHRCAY